jgi:hypothetical protein
MYCGGNASVNLESCDHKALEPITAYESIWEIFAKSDDSAGNFHAS